jgi:hypothetical protein
MSTYIQTHSAHLKEKKSFQFWRLRGYLFHVPAIVTRRVSRTRLRRICSKGLKIHRGKLWENLHMEVSGLVTTNSSVGVLLRLTSIPGRMGQTSKFDTGSSVKILEEQ